MRGKEWVNVFGAPEKADEQAECVWSRWLSEIRDKAGLADNDASRICGAKGDMLVWHVMTLVGSKLLSNNWPCRCSVSGFACFLQYELQTPPP